MIMAFFGNAVDLPSLRKKYGISIRGATLAMLVQISTDIGFRSRALRFDFEGIETLRLPCILHWGLNHFVVLASCKHRSLIIHDPARGRLEISRRIASDYISGVALEITAPGPLASIDRQAPLRIWQLLSGVQGVSRSLAQLFGSTALLQLSVAALPIFSQIALDGAVKRMEFPPRFLIAVGLLSMVAFRLCAEATRASVASHLASRLGIESRADLFSRLHQLPIEFFQRHNVPMLMARFQMLTDLLNLNTEGAISLILDGAMCVFGIAVFMFYSVRLGSVALTLSVVQVVATIVANRAQRRTMFEWVTSETRASGVLLDSLRSMSTAKVNGSEHQRLAQYINALIQAGSARVRKNAIAMLLNGVDTACLGARMAITVLLGVSLLRAGKLTIGALFAFSAYQELMATHLKGLLGQFNSLAAARVQLDMINDILAAEPESYSHSGQNRVLEKASELTLRKVCYRFSPMDACVLTDVNLCVRAGECVAIVGPSGSGKSTLLRIMMGLTRPTEGEFHVGDVDPWVGDIRLYRRSIAAVMQDDQLYSTTIRENISGGEIFGDSDRVKKAAERAYLADDILEMPMGYRTPVGDMGGGLSAGQKQRVILARALYREPAILFLDEATGNVDSETERQIVKAIGQMSMTRVVVTHRPEILTIADRVFELKRGRLHLINDRSGLLCAQEGA